MTIKQTKMTRLFGTSCALALALCVTGCPSDDGSSDDEIGETDEETTEDTTDDTTEDTTDDTTEDTTTTEEESSTETGEDPFSFADNDPSEYTQIDRAGMPAINSAVITSKDEYNADNPVSDIDGVYVPEIIANLTGLHDALDDDLAGFDLTPCLVDDCVAQAAPLVIPDTLTLDLEGAAGFPNGRGLADPVMDVTLAVVLLDLEVHEVTTLVGVLNPDANDVPFQDSFPYLADPN